MQTCTRCNAQSPDTASRCENCQAEFPEFSAASAALKSFQDNPRVHHVILSIMNDACPACQKYQGAYAKDQAPSLPIEGCSHPNGCRCFYQPVLTEIYP